MKFEFRFPDIGEGIAEGTIMKWLVKEGEIIEEGESIVEIETDKVTTEIPSPRTGKVLELKFEEGDTVEVEQVFVVIDTSDDSVEVELPEFDEGDIKDELEEKEEGVEETAGVVGEVIASSEEIPASTEGQITGSNKPTKNKVLATPVARQMAKDLGVDITKIEGTGPNGRVMKEDIRKAKEKISSGVVETRKLAKETKKETPIEENNVERISLTRIRKTIAEQMSKSRFTIPHTTAMDEMDISELVKFRNKAKDKLIDEDITLTYLPFIIKAVVKVLKEYPEFNASFDEENQELILKHFYHIGIATDTDRGLMVPVLRDVDKKSIVDMAEEIKDLTSRAKNNEIELHELKGSTFTITNYGSIGGLYGIPIINHPESAILGIGRIIKKPIVKNDEIVIAHVLPLSLSYDHRIIDGASGARFLNLLSELLMDPEVLLLKA